MIRRSNFKYLALTLVVIYLLHWLFTTFDPQLDLSELPSPENGLKIVPLPPNENPGHPKQNLSRQIGKANACFVILIRNGDLHDFRPTMRQLEDRFNRHYNYPYVFLNDVPFTEEFKKFTSALTNAKTEYGLIPEKHWSIPSHIDKKLVEQNLEKMRNEILYGGSLPYRHMCRFESGFFFRHELLDKYDHYWRVEPGVQFYCDIDFDPFVYIRDRDIKYEFIKEYPQYIEKDNLMDFISSDNGETCHFWSNFEIGDLNFWRGEAYTQYFNYLDKKGGFFYERWGDAPVHSIAAALFLKKHQVHFFNEIGYKHEPFTHCPKDEKLQLRCHCNPDDSFDFDGYSCTGKYLDLISKSKLEKLQDNK
ncbi:2464_t:CDS:2 [Cetraspora pellucida]|uniref:2464_t:CDS:1 n=1 Tax=Cetraspora pellucida TaxID=1433469 RepID=A0A9N9G5C1_9GLOM|nr:2464_t:CDS:2 [Cetraspora pellucida]